MRSIFVVLALLLLTTSGLKGQSTQALHPEDAGYAMARHTLSSGVEFARCIRENDRTCLRATPEETLHSYQEAFPELGLKTVGDLALRAESWIVEPCPRAYVSLARLNLPSRTIDFLFARQLRAGEMCFFDTNLGVYVGSAGCGNAFKDKNIGRDQPDPVSVRAEVSLTLGQTIRDTFSLTVIRGTRVSLVGDGEHRNIWVDTTFNIPRPSAWRFSVVDTTARAVTPPPARIITNIVKDTVWVNVPSTGGAKKGGFPWGTIAGFAIGVGAGWLANELSIEHKCKSCNRDTGGPVDPPNRKARVSLISVVF